MGVLPNGKFQYGMTKVEIDETLLKEIAEATGGLYFRATDNKKLEEIYAEINKLEKTEIEEFKYYNYQEKYRMLILFALGLLGVEWILRNTIFKRTGTKPKGPIRLLTHLRYFGYCFNPVSFYYCFDKDDDKVEYILAEVTNTPWKERFSYVLRASSNKQENKIRSYMESEINRLGHSSFVEEILVPTQKVIQIRKGKKRRYLELIKSACIKEVDLIKIQTDEPQAIPLTKEGKARKY